MICVAFSENMNFNLVNKQIYKKKRIFIQKSFYHIVKESITIAVSGHNSLGIWVGKFHFEMTPSPDEYCQAFIIYTFEFTGEQTF